MRRKLFTFMSLLSLLLCFGTLVTWAVLWRFETAYLDFGNHPALGEMLINRDGWFYGHAVSESFSDPRIPNWGGFEVMVQNMKMGDEVIVHVPHWFVAETAALLPAVWLATRRCAVCGYDLTGNVSGVCSECGTAVVKAGKVGA